MGRLLYLPLAIVLAALLGYPILRLFGAAMPNGFNLTAFSDYFANAARVRALVVTFRDSAAVAVAATFMGFVLAWALGFKFVAAAARIDLGRCVFAAPNGHCC